jgi:hypothetical protein
MPSRRWFTGVGWNGPVKLKTDGALASPRVSLPHV